MVGNLVLDDCLSSNQISEVRSLVRKPSGRQHPKLTEIVVPDFTDYAQHLDLFQGVDVGFFCIGVYSGQVPDAEFKKITVDYAVAFAAALHQQSPAANLCLLSGAGADKTEQSRTPFARYKGMAENQIARLTPNSYAFRPGYIYPVEARKEPNIGYSILRTLYPLLRAFGPKYSIRSTELARAMFNVGLHGADLHVLENKDILDQLGAA